MSTELAIQSHDRQLASFSSFGIDFFNKDQLELAKQAAQFFSQSKLVPVLYQGNIGNCVIAIDLSVRMKTGIMTVMQNLNVIHGKPSWSAAFVIGLILSSGRFTQLKYDISDLGEVVVGNKRLKNLQCVAYAWSKADKETIGKPEFKLEGVPVTIQMAVDEGWYSKPGSKWQTMPELMLRYRAATFFGRMYANDLMNGMQTTEEVIDIETTEVEEEKRINERLTITGASEGTERKTRAKKGAAAAATDPVVTPPPPAEPQGATPGDVPAPAAPATTPQAHASEPASPPAPTPPPPAADDKGFTVMRVSVEEAVAVNAPGGAVWSRLTLKGDTEFQCFFKAPLDKSPAVGSLIEGKFSEQPSRADPAKKAYVLESFTVLG